MFDRIVLHSLTFTGPGKTPAALTFGDKLTLIWGASNTGKSFALKALDFMFGGSKPLPDIEERHGYDTAWLALALPSEGDVTLSRALSGGAFLLHPGNVTASVPGGKVRTLQPKHDAVSDGNLSALLLAEIGLRGKEVATNAFGQKRQLSFRDLGLTYLVDETSIQIERSPVEGGQRGDRTTERSVFRLLLTGMDDSTIVAVEDPKSFNAAKQVRLEVVDEMIAEVDAAIKSEVPDVKGLEEQLDRLEESMEGASATFASLQTSIRDLLTEKQALARSIPDTSSRLDEVSLHIDRFEQLQEIYASDVGRLEALEEAGFLLSLSSTRDCPLCGAAPEAQIHAHDHQDIALIREASLVEIAKIRRQSGDLSDTIATLQDEKLRLRVQLPRLVEQLGKLEVDIADLVPLATQSQSDLGQIVAARDKVQRGLALLAQRGELSRRRGGYEGAKAAPKADRPVLEVASSTTHEFAQIVSSVLQQWGFPGEHHVAFDRGTYDLKIDGKARIANGKGVRAVTHAAFKVALLLFCRQKGLPHPGFLVLDTPLLTYRDPLKTPRFGELEDDERALAATSLKDRFFEHLASLHVDAQFVILENVDPPDGLGGSARLEVFSGGGERPGLFPT
jgi:predicted  nucleic acid-binding Zn-ribbon protein